MKCDRPRFLINNSVRTLQRPNFVVHHEHFFLGVHLVVHS
jgi:hypothetical protein